jgi:hypothetical protein
LVVAYAQARQPPPELSVVLLSSFPQVAQLLVSKRRTDISGRGGRLRKPQWMRVYFAARRARPAPPRLDSSLSREIIDQEQTRGFTAVMLHHNALVAKPTAASSPDSNSCPSCPRPIINNALICPLLVAPFRLARPLQPHVLLRVICNDIVGIAIRASHLFVGQAPWAEYLFCTSATFDGNSGELAGRVPSGDQCGAAVHSTRA